MTKTSYPPGFRARVAQEYLDGLGCFQNDLSKT